MIYILFIYWVQIKLQLQQKIT